jgi:hypothetical protein
MEQVAEDEIADARKLVVSCEDLPTPPEKAQGDGTIQYHMQRYGYREFGKESDYQRRIQPPRRPYGHDRGPRHR